MTKDECRALELASALSDATVTVNYGNAHWALSKDDVFLLRIALKQYVSHAYIREILENELKE